MEKFYAQKNIMNPQKTPPKKGQFLKLRNGKDISYPFFEIKKNKSRSKTGLTPLTYAFNPTNRST